MATRISNRSSECFGYYYHHSNESSTWLGGRGSSSTQHSITNKAPSTITAERKNNYWHRRSIFLSPLRYTT